MNKLDAALNFQQTALRIRNQRQEILASNIANADTPQYKARDIDFASAMASALKQSPTSSGGQQQAGQYPSASGMPSALQTTSQGHISGSNSNSYAGSNEPLFRPIVQGSVDGNTVDMDAERNAYVDNAVRYEASLTMISGQIKKMLSAISGQ